MSIKLNNHMPCPVCKNDKATGLKRIQACSMCGGKGYLNDEDHKRESEMFSIFKATTEPSSKRDTQEIEIVSTFVVRHESQYKDGVWFSNIKDLTSFLEDELDIASDCFNGCSSINPKGEAEDSWTIEIHMKPKGYPDTLEPYDP